MKGLPLVSLYTGAGGLDYGLEAAGFEVAAAIDLDGDSCATVRANTEWPVLCEDISHVTGQTLMDVAGLRRGDVALLAGGPPCQPFSKSGYWATGDTLRMSDPRSSTISAYMRIVADVLPKVFLLENVHGIAYSGKEEGFSVLGRMTRDVNHRHGTNYQLSWAVLNAADYGVPQTRTRFFLVGHRDGREFLFPTQTHGKVDDVREQTEFWSDAARLRPVTAWDSIGAFESETFGEDLRVTGQWADLLPSIPEGENYLWHTNRKGGMPLFGWRTRFWTFLLKLAKQRPSWTLQAQPGPAVGPFHWTNRRLSTVELATLQTFPPALKFVGSRVSVQRQIGNAVPSLLAEVLGRGLAAQFFDKEYKSPLVLSVPLSEDIPPPEPIAPVPDKYFDLLGDHADHPGEGRGRRARPALGVLS